DAGCGMGRPHLLLRRCPCHPQHPAVHGIGGRCPGLSVGGARGGAHEPHRRHQGGPDRCRRQGGRLAQRRYHGRGWGAGRRLPPLLRAAGGDGRRTVDMAELLNRQPRTRGPRLMIVTNAGGPAVLAADALVAGGAELCELSVATEDALNRVLPSHWSHGNPVDILGGASPNRYDEALQIAGGEPNADGVLIIMAPQGMTDPAEVANRVATFTAHYGKPVLASWMGAASVKAGIAALNRAGVPTFDFPDSAARAFNYMWQYSRNLDALYEIPAAAEDGEANGAVQSSVADLIAGV